MERDSLRALWLKERTTAAATMCTIPVLACVGTLAGFTDFIIVVVMSVAPIRACGWRILY